MEMHEKSFRVTQISLYGKMIFLFGSGERKQEVVEIKENLKK